MTFLRRLVATCLALLVFLGSVFPVSAIESTRVPLDAPAIDLTKAIERYSAQGDRLLVSTAPGSDGIVRRIEVARQGCRHTTELDRLRAHQ